MELRGLRRRHGEMLELGATLFFVGPETEADARKLLARNETDIPILLDGDGAVMEAWGLAFELPERLRPMYRVGLGFPDRNPATGWRLPVPATYVVDGAGVVRARHCLADYRYRMEPRDILEALRALPPAEGR